MAEDWEAVIACPVHIRAQAFEGDFEKFENAVEICARALAAEFASTFKECAYIRYMEQREEIDAEMGA